MQASAFSVCSIVDFFHLVKLDRVELLRQDCLTGRPVRVQPLGHGSPKKQALPGSKTPQALRASSPSRGALGMSVLVVLDEQGFVFPSDAGLRDRGQQHLIQATRPSRFRYTWALVSQQGHYRLASVSPIRGGGTTEPCRKGFVPSALAKPLFAHKKGPPRTQAQQPHRGFYSIRKGRREKTL